MGLTHLKQRKNQEKTLVTGYHYAKDFGNFRFGIFGITSGGGPLISVGIFRPKFDKPVLCPNKGFWKRNKNWQESFLLVDPV